MSNLIVELENFIAAKVNEAVTLRLEALGFQPAHKRYTRTEAAEALRVGETSLYSYEYDGYIARTTGPGVWYTGEEIENCKLRLAGKLALVAAPRKPRKQRAKLKENVAAV